MERETLRRQAEEARRCGAIESINGVPLDADGTKPIFGPPVKIRNRDDSLHRKLQKCLGNFDDVSGYLFKDMHYAGRGMESSIGLEPGLARPGGRSRLNGHSNGIMATKGHGGRRSKNNTCHRSGAVSAQSARRRRTSSLEHDSHGRHGRRRSSREQQVAYGINSPSEPPLPLEVANLIKEMREMIATPLTGISTPKQDRVSDYGRKATLPYANGYQRLQMREKDQRTLNGFRRHGQSPYLKRKFSGSRRDTGSLNKESSPVSETGRKSTPPLKRQASFSVLNDDLLLSEDSDAKEEGSDVEAISDEVVASPVHNLASESSPALSCFSGGAAGETSPLTEAESELPNPVEIEYAAKSAIPENPWDIDYLISKTLNKSGSPGEPQSNAGTGRGPPSPTTKEQTEDANANCRFNHEMVKQCIDDLFEDEDDAAKSVRNDSASDVDCSALRSELESSDEATKQLPVVKRKKEKKRKRNELLEPSRSGCHLADDPASQTDDTQRSPKVSNGISGSRALSSSPAKYEASIIKADASTSDVETILMDYSCLLPLLSPIRPQSSTPRHRSAAPLICRLDLTLVPRLPSPIHAKAVEAGLEEVHCRNDADRSDWKESSTAMVPPSCEQVPNGEPAHKAGDTSTGIEKPLPSAAADLDDVPILERMKKSLGSFRRIAKRTPAEKPVQVKQTSSPDKPEQTRAESERDTRAQKPAVSVDHEAQVQRDKSLPSSGAKRRLHQQQAPSELKEEKPPSPQAKRSRMELHSQCLLQMAPHSALRVYMDEKEPQVYLEKAKRVKHAADAQTADKSLRIILYLESVIYFVLTGHCMEKTLSADSSRPYSMLKETCELLKGVSQKYFAQSAVSADSYVTFLNSKIEVLSLRVQALLCLKLYELREPQAVNNYRHISQYQLTAKEGNDRQCSSANPYVGSGSHGESQQAHSQHTSLAGVSSSRQTSPGDPPSAVAHSPTPSPASSTGSSHSLAPGLVVIPQNVENLYKQQLSHLHNLMWAHLKWNLSVKKMTKDDEQFFAHLDSVCMPLHITSSIGELCTFMLTAADWLRRFHSTQSKSFSRPCGIRHSSLSNWTHSRGALSNANVVPYLVDRNPWSQPAETVPADCVQMEPFGG